MDKSVTDNNRAPFNRFLWKMVSRKTQQKSSMPAFRVRPLDSEQPRIAVLYSLASFKSIYWLILPAMRRSFQTHCRFCISVHHVIEASGAYHVHFDYRKISDHHIKRVYISMRNSCSSLIRSRIECFSSVVVPPYSQRAKWPSNVSHAERPAIHP